jgi:hypothetical protein
VSHALDEHAEAVRAAASREQETLRGGHAQLSSHAQAEVSKHQEAVTAAGAQHAAEVRHQPRPASNLPRAVTSAHPVEHKSQAAWAMMRLRRSKVRARKMKIICMNMRMMPRNR